MELHELLLSPDIDNVIVGLYMIQHITPQQLHIEFMRIQKIVKKVYGESDTGTEELHRVYKVTPDACAFFSSMTSNNLLLSVYVIKKDYKVYRLLIWFSYHVGIQLTLSNAAYEKGKFIKLSKHDNILVVPISSKTTKGDKELVYNTIIEHLHGTT
jgi:hypothetical protein